MSLRLAALSIPPLAGREIRAFADEQRSQRASLRPRTDPARGPFLALALAVLPKRELKQGVDEELGSFATRCRTPRPAVELQLLYDSYVEAIRRTIAEALAEGWYWLQESPGNITTWCGLGMSGIYVISDPVKLARPCCQPTQSRPARDRQVRPGR